MNASTASMYGFNNLILIGMPGAGKSTIGVILAKALGLQFVDTDLEIQRREGRLLQTIVDAQGHLHLRKVESQVCQELDCDNSVVATGGSVVYSPAAMDALSQMGRIIWLSVPLEEIQRRVDNVSSRGLVRSPEQSLEDLLREREPLYRQYAQVTVHCDRLRPDEVVTEILTRVAGNLAL